MNIEHNVIIDGYNLIHRARGGFQKGDWPIVFNFFRGLRPLLEKHLPISNVIIALEGTPKRQNALLPEYKSNRAPAPDGFARQRDAIIEILKMLPVTLALHPNYEADDVVFNLIRRMNENSKVTVISSDSDFTQLLQLKLRPDSSVYKFPDVSVWNWKTEEFLETPDFDYVKWKALRGDPTDNIPKCPGMGDKTALMTLNDTNRFNNAMNDSVIKRLYDRNIELIRLADISDEEWRLYIQKDGVTNFEKIAELFESYEFKSMLKDTTWSKWMKTFKSIGFVG